jgi:hypothetical protein
LISQTEDALRERRSVFHVAEPVVRLHRLVVARNEASLVAGRAEQAWVDNVDMVASRIYGPHFEELAREWCFEYASEQTLSGRASAARPTEIACREHRNGHELDVVVLQTRPYGPDGVIAVGEAKGGTEADGPTAPRGVGPCPRHDPGRPDTGHAEDPFVRPFGVHRPAPGHGGRAI